METGRNTPSGGRGEEMPVVIVRIAAPYPAEGPLTQRESGFWRNPACGSIESQRFDRRWF